MFSLIKQTMTTTSKFRQFGSVQGKDMFLKKYNKTNNHESYIDAYKCFISSRFKISFSTVLHSYVLLKLLQN